jgi:hypothetical protein
MKQVVGLILIILGVALIIISVLVWLGVLTPAGAQLNNATAWDVLLELVRKLPWVALVGLLLTYAGVRCLGVRILER